MANGRSGTNSNDTIKLHDCDFLKKVGYFGSEDLLTLDDLERLKRHSCTNGKVLQSPPEKFQRRQIDTIGGAM